MGTSNKILNRIVLFTFTVALIFTPAIVFAQDEACQGSDPTGNSTTCPLDTWVWILVIGAAIFGVISLSRRQKLQQRF